MIEEALRKRLQPIVNRRRHLYLARRLSVLWLVFGLIGICLIGTNWLWGWKSPVVNWALFILAALGTILVLYKARRMQPDYRAVARNIEQQHPDLQALLLAAIEQEPKSPDGLFGYLQEWVIQEALAHATNYDWVRSVSTNKLVLANIGWIAALLFLIAILSQMLPSTSSSHRTDGGVLTRKGYRITVTPGDTTVELGTPVVILARFDGRVPPEASLLFGASGQELQQITLSKNLDDPVFGGIIQDVKADIFYHIEYAGRRTRDYKISVYEYPSLTRADAKIVYPSYTKLPEKVIIDTRQVSVLEGSQVILTFILNKAVTTAQLVPKDEPVLELTVNGEHPNIYTTSITATQSQRYELHLADAQGRASPPLVGPPRFVIDVHKNLPPELRIVFPNRDVVASPLEELSLEAEVSDDYGVTSYGLNYTLAGTQSKDITQSQSAVSNEKRQIQYLLALEELNAQPDQLLTYYFWADDVGPNGNIRRTTSDMYFGEVRHFEEIFRESQSFQDQSSQDQRENQSGEQQQGRQGEQLARLQKQIISATWNIKQQADQSGGLDDQEEDLDVVRQSQADVLKKARSASTQAGQGEAIDQTEPATKALQAATKYMETSLDHLSRAAESASTAELTPALAAEQSAYQELLKLRQREHQVALARNSSRSNNDNAARFEQQLQQLELKQRENRYETERLAQSQEQATQREDIQVLNRLRDLARRQSEMSDKLKESQAALQQAQNEQQKQEILRELKRLREEQMEAIRDVDELQQRMERPENRQRMAQTREQLTDSRSRIRQSADELEQGMVSRAITSTTRAQRQLEQMREDFRHNAASQFADQMRNMRDQAQQLDQRQREIADQIRQQVDSRQKTLTDTGVNRELADRIDQQKKSAEELIDQMKDVSEQAETSEPLLSRTLYDTLRKASTDNVDKALEVAGELLRRNFLPQAREIERQAGKGIEDLRKGVEEAARNVLGDEAESLRLARQQLDELIKQVNDEVARAGSTGRQRSSSDSNNLTDSAANQTRRANAQSRTSSVDAGRNDDQQRSSPRDGQQTRDTRSARTNADGQNNPTSRSSDSRSPERLGGIDTHGPITGNDFRQWSDRLRDVEEMLTEEDLRNEAARVRDRARAIRAEFTRHGKEPQWDLVRQQITNPLVELRERVKDKLAQLQSDKATVPIDRDPVPGRFTDVVRRYFENLGGND